MPNQESPHLFINRRDWSFDHRGDRDEARHKEKVKEAIRGNLDSIISDGSIITEDPQSKKIIKVPMRSLETPRFKYKDGNQGIGQGEGDVGDVIDKRPGKSGNKPGQGEGAGQEPGVEYYEAELTIEEIQEMVFADLGLPNLKPKAKESLQSEEVVFDQRRKRENPNILDLILTAKENKKRNAREHGKAEIKDISPEDHVGIFSREKIAEQNSAVVILEIDDSGSMGPFEKYLARAYSWWAVSLLKTKYPKVDIVFITHDTEAQEVNEEQFFSKVSSGGTRCSSAKELEGEIIEKRYPPDQYNIYSIHFSDGDNWGAEDNAKYVKQTKERLDLPINQAVYVQVGPPRASSLKDALDRGINDERFKTITINKKEDVLPGLKKAFPPDKS